MTRVCSELLLFRIAKCMMVNRTDYKLNMPGDTQDTLTPQAGAAGCKLNMSMACREPQECPAEKSGVGLC